MKAYVAVVVRVYIQFMLHLCRRCTNSVNILSFSKLHIDVKSGTQSNPQSATGCCNVTGKSPRYPLNRTLMRKYIVAYFVTKEGVTIENWIYCTLETLQFNTEPTKSPYSGVSSSTASINSSQRRKFLTFRVHVLTGWRLPHTQPMMVTLKCLFTFSTPQSCRERKEES
jgi:hypothetical protein